MEAERRQNTKSEGSVPRRALRIAFLFLFLISSTFSSSGDDNQTARDFCLGDLRPKLVEGKRFGGQEDSWYVYEGGATWTEYKGHVTVFAEKLTKADELNLVVWKGTIKLEVDAQRKCDYQRGVERWMPWEEPRDPITLCISKNTGGTWSSRLGALPNSSWKDLTGLPIPLSRTPRP